MVDLEEHKETAEQKIRYKFNSVAKNESTKSSLTEKNQATDAPLSASLVEAEGHKNTEEPIYDLVVTDKDLSQHQAETEAHNSEATLNEQIAQLACGYEKVNQQLEKSLSAINGLTLQLAAAKQVSKTNYITLGLAGVAFLIGMGATVFAINMQRDVADLKEALNTLTQQTSVTQKQLSAKDKEIETQVAQITQKVDSAFATDSLNNVLQVTQELKKQIQALANKNLASLMDTQTSAAKPEKISLPSLTVAKTETAQTENAAVAEPTEKQPESSAKVDIAPAKADAAKELQNDEQSAVKDNAKEEKETGKWVVIFGVFKDKNAIDKFQKAGVPVEVVEAKQKYRISSKSFKSKQDAQQQAEYVKKTLKVNARVKKIK